MKFRKITLVLVSILASFGLVYSQEEGAPKEKDNKPMKNTFENSLLLDGESVVIPKPKSFEFIIQHRFGNLNSKEYDLLGLLATANIRIGFNYVIRDWLQIGVGTMKNYNFATDLNWKVPVLRQTKDNRIPLSITYYGNAVVEAGNKENYGNYAPDSTSSFKKVHRFNYFQELIIARKFHKNFSAQIYAGYSHFNLVERVPPSPDDSVTNEGIEHNNFSVGLSGRIKVSPQTSVLFEYTQPLSFPEQNQPQPNIALGVEIATSGHAFQITLGTYKHILPQYNMVYSTNKFWEGEIMLGFNMTRLWNF